VLAAPVRYEWARIRPLKKSYPDLNKNQQHLLDLEKGSGSGRIRIFWSDPDLEFAGKRIRIWNLLGSGSGPLATK
jgi:hypothetical protein